LTDLGETWFIIWPDSHTIWYYLFDCGNDAVDYLEHHLQIAADLLENPDMEIEPSGLDRIWSANRQNLLPTVEEEQPSAEGRLLELDGMLSVEEE
jgi:hypothetical protein